MMFFLTSLFSLFELIEEIRRTADIHMHAIVALVLFKTQLLHDRVISSKARWV